jgi:hypothetical protein
MGSLLIYLVIKYKAMFKLLATINHWLLPNYTKEQLDLTKATKMQKAIIAWKYYVTTRAID